MRQFMIGYGSLIHPLERERAGLAPLATPVRLEGYRRAWNVQAENKKTYLGAVPAAAGRMNAVLFPVNGEGLAFLDGREGAYDRSEVPAAAVSERIGTGAKVWIYVPKPEWVSETPNAAFAVKRSYVDTVIDGCLRVSPLFCLDFIASTEGWQQYWYDNRRAPAELRAKVDALVGRFYPPSMRVRKALPPRGR